MSDLCMNSKMLYLYSEIEYKYNIKNKEYKTIDDLKIEGTGKFISTINIKFKKDDELTYLKSVVISISLKNPVFHKDLINVEEIIKNIINHLSFDLDIVFIDSQSKSFMTEDGKVCLNSNADITKCKFVNNTNGNGEIKIGDQTIEKIRSESDISMYKKIYISAISIENCIAKYVLLYSMLTDIFKTQKKVDYFIRGVHKGLFDKEVTQKESKKNKMVTDYTYYRNELSHLDKNTVIEEVNTNIEKLVENLQKIVKCVLEERDPIEMDVN